MTCADTLKEHQTGCPIVEYLSRLLARPGFKALAAGLAKLSRPFQAFANLSHKGASRAAGLQLAAAWVLCAGLMMGSAPMPQKAKLARFAGIDRSMFTLARRPVTPPAATPAGAAPRPGLRRVEGMNAPQARLR
jgi:hypothetical protein